MPSGGRPSLLLALALGLAASLGAADAAPQPASPWSCTGKLGVFFSNTASHNAESSRDPSIAGGNDSVLYKLTGELVAVWQVGSDRVEQEIDAEYGQMRSEQQGEWDENLDSLLYSATYERSLTGRGFVYGNGTVESVWTGKDPDNEPFDPLIAKVSAGYGQRYADLAPESDSLVWRAGVQVRKRWESHEPDYVTEVAAGPEWYIRYERKQSADVSWFGQYDGWCEFTDPAHASNLAQAGISVRVAKLLTIELKGRAYYEFRPEDAAPADAGYDQWSLRQEAVAGLLWEFASP